MDERLLLTGPLLIWNQSWVTSIGGGRGSNFIDKRRSKVIWSLERSKNERNHIKVSSSAFLFKLDQTWSLQPKMGQHSCTFSKVKGHWLINIITTKNKCLLFLQGVCFILIKLSYTDQLMMGPQNLYLTCGSKVICSQRG